MGRTFLLLLLFLVTHSASAETNWFIQGAVGAGQHDASLSLDAGSVDLLFEPDDKGSVYTIAVGYNFSERWFSTIEYSYYDADDTTLANVYASLNYRWPIGDRWQMFLGASAGSSTLEWQDDPIFATVSDDENDETLWGAQAGFQFQINERWHLQGRYQFLGTEHETRLAPIGGSGDFRHRDYHLVTVGITWEL